MSDFIFSDDVSIATKTDAIVITAAVSKSFRAADWNALRAALYDTRAGFRAGRVHGFAAEASRPVITDAEAFLWRRASDGHLLYYDGAADLDLSGLSSSRTITAGAGLTGGGDLSADRTFNVVANADGSIVVNANDLQVGVLATDAQHGNRGGGGLHVNAVASGAAGFMSGTDKAKLDGLPDASTLASTYIDSSELSSALTDYMPTSWTISPGGDLTGGGSGAANRTITLPDTLTAKTLAADNATSSGITDLLTLRHTAVGGAGSAGIGAGLLFETENGSSSTVSAGHLAGVLSTVTAGAEKGYLRARAMNGSGALGDAAYLWTTGLGIGTGTTEPRASIDIKYSGANPGTVLDIQGLAGTYGAHQIYRNGSLLAYIGITSGDEMQFYSAASTVIVSGTRGVLTNTRLGVGNTTLPAGMLDITTAGTVAGLNIISAATSGGQQLLVATGAAHTAQAASTERSQVDIDIGQTYTWSAGALALQRFFRVRQPTIDFASASTCAKAVTVSIGGPPVDGGANTTLTESWTLGIEAGGILVEQVSTDVSGIGLKLHTTDTPGSGLGFSSPLVKLRGSGKAGSTLYGQEYTLLMAADSRGSNDAGQLYGSFQVKNVDAEVMFELKKLGSDKMVAFCGATPAVRATYSATNVTTDRSYDADTVAVAELADVVGTLIADLRALGLVL